ncbi:sensor histidine kinase [Rubellimicrobium rubrum]|uniref:sensor histidine kinase n=1 Tax=Rubellimicrobium rubrum TaxID=2585369 RepID=UPI00159BE3C3|nr:histidine kinase dimerization/phosphoacceptor domain -containing protein [Rubellimicrobium rubrum]
MNKRATVIDDQIFETLDVLLDEAFCLCTILTDQQGRPVDYRFLRVSRNFEDATGLRDAEGRTALELVPSLESEWIEAYGRVALRREPMHFTEGSPTMGRQFDVFAAPVDPPGCFAILFRDVTEIRRIEAEREAELERLQYLLRELNHRVMNSFAVISSVLSMEARSAPEARAALERVQGRVQALGSLYRRIEGATQVDQIEIAEYLGGNVASFRDSFAGGVAITADLGAVTLPTRAAVPLGLIVNELLTEAVNRAFPPGESGKVHLTFAEKDGLCRLSVTANGTGLRDGAEESHVGRGLVAAFAAELGGELTTEFQDGGTYAFIEFRA